MTAPSEQRRLLAIMVADIAGYSRMMARDENGTFSRLRALQSAVIAPCVARNHGDLVKWTGDGFIATFSSAVDAVRAAVEIQSGAETANRQLPKGDRQRLRIGINVGDVIVVPGDVYGDAVNIAARLQVLAAEGGIAASQLVRDTVRGKFSVDFKDQGDVSVKNIPDRVRVFGINFRPEAWAMETVAVNARPRRSLLRYASIPLAVLAVYGGYRAVRALLASPPAQLVSAPQPGPAASLANRPVASAPTATPTLKPETPPADASFHEGLVGRIGLLVPALPAEARDRLANDYLASPLNRAMAVAPPAGKVWRVAGRPAAPIAVNEALEACEIIAGMPCGLIAQNERLEGAGSGAPLAIRPMQRVAHAGRYDAAMIPTGDFKTTDLARTYAEPHRYKALALHPTGWIFGNSSGATQRETERAALKSCLDDRRAKGIEGPCYLYAAGDYTVLAQRITSADAEPGAEADLFEGVWRGTLEGGRAASLVVLGGRAVFFALDETVQPITKSAGEGKAISFGDRRYAVSITLDGASDLTVDYTGPTGSMTGVLRKQ